MRRVRWRNLPNDQKIVQHPHRSELLLNGRFGSRKVLNPGSHMERPNGCKLQAVNGAPVKKLPASSGVSLPGISVADRGGEKVNVGRKPQFPRRRRAASGEAGALFAVTFDASADRSESISQDRGDHRFL